MSVTVQEMRVTVTGEKTIEVVSAFAPAEHVGSGGAAHAAATTSQAGFLSAADKQKLDNQASKVVTGVATVPAPTYDIAGWTATAEAYAYVALSPALPSSNYAVSLSVEVANQPQGIGALKVAEKATNGFKIVHTGSSQLTVRWTLVLP